MGARRAIAISFIAAGLLLAGAVPASADPGGADDAFPLLCDNGITYQIVLNGNGEFSPGHDINSTSTLVPTAFGPFIGTVTDPAGNVVDVINEPASAKGASSRARATTVSCTFHFEGTDADGFTFSADGSVTGFVTPLR